MRFVKSLLHWIFERIEAGFDRVFGTRLSPFSNLGALSWFFFWVVSGTGIYLYIFFDTGIVDAYESVQYMTVDQWYAAGVARSLHRYTSDALLIVVILHMLREFSRDRLRGKRFFAWVTGIPALFLVYVCGISGYWLVWDQLAQYIAVSTTEFLDALPIFGEPIANNFLNNNTLSDRFFTLMVFIHIFGPLFMLFLMWIHIQRFAGARVSPPRPLAIGSMAGLLGLSIVNPAVSQSAANLDVVPATVALDWFYLAGYPVLDILPAGQLWMFAFLCTLILFLLPWLPRLKSPAAATVSLDNCNGCARCFDDCPFSAIEMVPRSDGKPYAHEARVNTSHCLSCGICVGSCPTATPFRRATDIVPGIELPDHTISQLRERAIEASKQFVTGRRVLVFACDHSQSLTLKNSSTQVLAMPCVAMLPPSFIDFVLSRNLADGVALSGCAETDCYFRLGDVWTNDRLNCHRDPHLRRRVDKNRLRFWRLRPNATDQRRAALDEFHADLRQLPKNQSRHGRKG